MVIANNADHFAAASAFFLMTPPNVLGAPKPWSSVMMSKHWVGSSVARRAAATRRLGGLLLNHAAEFRIGRRKLFSGDRRRGFWRTWYSRCLLCQRRVHPNSALNVTKEALAIHRFERIATAPREVPPSAICRSFYYQMPGSFIE